MPAASVSSLTALGDAFALNAPSDRKRMLVIVNPYATTVSDRLKNLVVYALRPRTALAFSERAFPKDATRWTFA